MQRQSTHGSSSMHFCQNLSSLLMYRFLRKQHLSFSLLASSPQPLLDLQPWEPWDAAGFDLHSWEVTRFGHRPSLLHRQTELSGAANVKLSAKARAEIVG